MTFVQEIEIKHPDTKTPVTLEVWRDDDGGLFAIEAEYLDDLDGEAYSPNGQKYHFPEPFDGAIAARSY